MMNQLKLMKRILFNVSIVASLVFFQWWITLILILIGFFVFPKFYEGIVWGFIIDALFGTPRTVYLDFVFITLLITMTLFFFSDIMKSRLRMY